MPAHRAQRLARLAPVLGDERRVRVRVGRVHRLERLGHAGVQARAPRAELGAVGHLVGQRVLEGVDDLRIQRLLEQQLLADQGGELRRQLGALVAHAAQQRL
jgi:hypothetical protein